MTLPVAKRFDVFLSYSTSHRAAVAGIALDLRREEVEPWFDEWERVGGRLWQPELAAGVLRSRTCAVFIGPGKVGPWSQEEFQLALSRAQREPAFRVIPVLLPGAERADLEGDERLAFLLQRNVVCFDTIDDSRALRWLANAIRDIPDRDPSLQAVFEGRCPYRGLEAFTEADSGFFFGRERIIQKLLAQLDPSGPGAGNRFLLIVGDSGSGKSSLALAGLMAAFGRGEVAGSAGWVRCRLVPGSNPIANLAAALWNQETVRSHYHGSILQLQDDLSRDPAALDLIARAVLADRPPDERLVILVDQFEEVFTECTDESQRRALIESLIDAGIGKRDGRTLVILTMRADFFGKCAHYPALRHAVRDRYELVGPMTEDEIREVILRPAELVGCQFEGSLADILIDDVRGKPASLPLLQHSLLELWERRVDNRLTYDKYVEIGRVEGALTHRAEREYARLTAAEQRICRLIFLRLVQPDQDRILTRRRVVLRELNTDPEQEPLVATVLRRLTDRKVRLLVTGGDPETPTIEVAHEALFTNWKRLLGWVGQAQDALLTAARLAEAAAVWKAHQDHADYLYRGMMLSEMRDFVLEYEEHVDPSGHRFLAASMMHELLARPPDVLAREIEALRPFAVWVIAALREMLENAPGSSQPARSCRIWLALLQLEGDRQGVAQILELLDDLPLTEMLGVREALASWSDELVGELWQSLRKETTPDVRLRAALLLAGFEPKDPSWAELADRIVADLVTSSPIDLPVWLRGLVPAGRHPENGLVSALRRWYVDESPRESVRSAAVAFSHFSSANENPATRARLLAEAASVANAKAYDAIYDALAADTAARAVAVEVLGECANEAPADDLPHGARVRSGRRRAGATITLLRLGEPPPAAVLSSKVDPEARSQFVARVYDRGVPASCFVELLETAEDPTFLYSVLLSLGSYPIEDLPNALQAVEKIRRLYREDDDPGIHGACGWLLAKWNLESEPLDAARLTLPRRAGRQWFVQPLEPRPLAMMIYPPGRFLMGSSEVAQENRERAKDEVPAHWVEITRSFALADRHVTRGQYGRFFENLRGSPLLPRIIQWTAVARKFDTFTDANQAMPAVNWFAAVLFCRWLTREAGMDEEDQCYPDPSTLELHTDGFPETWALDASRPGYRLPTEAEWEYACRCGTQTAYSFGNDVTLLGDYGWYVANEAHRAHEGGLKMPNPRGVFDMHGNLFEWCHDWYAPYPSEEQVDPQGPLAGRESERAQALRGGSYYNHEFDCRSATRAQIPTPRRFLLIGFRVARTITHPVSHRLWR